ncbi:MAG: hypothetical protein LBM73_00500 [Candidatus Nomurabacteria bacterium]|jgi:hypothetical protein|nr:hypothetical protein [Candidatus Nomurabacteria bacterium]
MIECLKEANRSRRWLVVVTSGVVAFSLCAVSSCDATPQTPAAKVVAYDAPRGLTFQPASEVNSDATVSYGAYGQINVRSDPRINSKKVCEVPVDYYTDPVQVEMADVAGQDGSDTYWVKLPEKYLPENCKSDGWVQRPYLAGTLNRISTSTTEAARDDRNSAKGAAFYKQP